MTVIILSRSVGEPPQLFMQPDNDQDRRLLNDLISNFQLTGMGRDPDTLAPIHVEIELQEKAK